MSEILIRDTEMPKRCFGCDYRCGLNILARKNPDGRHEDCPMKEIPPHGELKDVSVMLYYLSHMKGVTEHDNELLKTFEKMIRNCPTVIERSKDYKGR